LRKIARSRDHKITSTITRKIRSETKNWNKYNIQIKQNRKQRNRGREGGREGGREEGREEGRVGERRDEGKGGGRADTKFKFNDDGKLKIKGWVLSSEENSTLKDKEKVNHGSYETTGSLRWVMTVPKCRPEKKK
jgi:hypothetical protein